MDDKAETKLQNQIFDQTRKLTNLLKDSEKRIQQIKNSESGNPTDDQIKTNVVSILACNIRDLT